MTRSIVVAVLALLVGAGSTGAQMLVEISISGASEEASAFTTAYSNAPAAGTTWGVSGKAATAYRVDAPTGTVSITAVLAANTAPRIAQGPSSTQTIRLRFPFAGTTIDSANGGPGEALQVDYSFPFSTPGTPRVVVAVDVFPLNASCGLANTPCSTITFYLVFMLRQQVELSFGGTARPRLFAASLVDHFQMLVNGVNPFTDVTGASIDGVALTRIPSGTVPLGQTPGELKWDRSPMEQLPATDAVFPGGTDPTGFERFLGCGGGGCTGSPGVRVGLPADIDTGLHTVRVTGQAFANGVYDFYGGNSLVDVVGNASLLAEEQFILLDPKVTITPDPAVAGQTMTVTGTGFFPDVTLPIGTRIPCCGSGLLALGEVHTDLRGDFSFTAQLPPPNAAFFTSSWGSNAAAGATADGSVSVPWADAATKATYGEFGYDQTVSVTYVHPGAGGGTTTTTLPGGCTSDAACDDGDPCTLDACAGGACTHTQLDGAACAVPPGGLGGICTAVPPKVDKRFDKAAELLGRALDKPRKALRRLVKKADKLLKKTKRLAEVAEVTGDILPECAEGIVDVVDDVRTRISFVLDQP
jgi:hypothetical protein